MLVKTESVDMIVGEQSSHEWGELVQRNVKKTFHQKQKYYRYVLNSL